MQPRSLICFMILVALFAAGSFGAVPVQAGEAQEITVSAAMSLKAVLEDLGRRYQERGSTPRIVFNFGASGDLAAQIAAGAPVDVFVSAAPEDMDRLESAGLVRKGTRRDIASNTVVLIVPARSTASITSFSGLAGPDVRRIALADPRTSPAGRYAEDVIRHAGIRERIQDRIVYAGNVRQILDYVARGEVDAGVVYGTDALSRQKDVSVVATAPAGSHPAVVYPIAMLKGARSETAAQDLISFLVSRTASGIFRQYGFSVPAR